MHQSIGGVVDLLRSWVDLATLNKRQKDKWTDMKKKI